MTKLHIREKAVEAIKAYKLPSEISFGVDMAPVMVVCDYQNGEWGDLELLPYGPISLAPTAKVFHYAQEIFEGLKVYKVEGHGPYLFRPEKNAARFRRSASRMGMPELPEEMFLQAVKGMTSFCQDIVPGQSGQSLYLRPFMFATEESLGIKPSLKYKFMVIASPSGAYFTKGTLPVFIERQAARACPGGTGRAKTGGNYAASIQSSKKALSLGCLQTLWLDALEKKYIEEMSGMNFFAVIGGELITPELTDTILDGITRQSVIEIAPGLGFKVKEERINIDQLIQQIKNGTCQEAFACGTAAIVTPIECLTEEDGTRYDLPHQSGEIVSLLRKTLMDIQEGRCQGPNGWRVEI